MSRAFGMLWYQATSGDIYGMSDRYDNKGVDTEITIWAEKDLKKSVVPHFTQSRVSHEIRPNYSGWYQMSPENYQSWRLRSLSRQPAPMLCHFHDEIFFLVSNLNWLSLWPLSFLICVPPWRTLLHLLDAIFAPGSAVKPSKVAPSPGWTSLALWPLLPGQVQLPSPFWLCSPEQSVLKLQHFSCIGEDITGSSIAVKPNECWPSRENVFSLLAIPLLLQSCLPLCFCCCLYLATLYQDT